jgi:hypothetical protein
MMTRVIPASQMSKISMTCSRVAFRMRRLMICRFVSHTRQTTSDTGSATALDDLGEGGDRRAVRARHALEHLDVGLVGVRPQGSLDLDARSGGTALDVSGSEPVSADEDAAPVHERVAVDLLTGVTLLVFTHVVLLSFGLRLIPQDGGYKAF